MRIASNKKYDGPCTVHQKFNRHCKHCRSIKERERQIKGGPEYTIHNGIGLRLRDVRGEPYGVINMNWLSPEQIREREAKQAVESEH
jgi:hypothetical protein